MGKIIIDQYYLTLTFLITLVWQLLGFAIAFTLQFDKITDVWGGVNFFALALITLTVGGDYHARNIVASVLMMIWAARLGGFLLFRVLKTATDGRFDEMRANPIKFGGFWSFQILWVWIVSLPVVILNSPSVSSHPSSTLPSFGTGRDIAGVVLFAIGFFWEAVSDAQKYRHKSRGESRKDRPCTVGLWRFSRHPPYFGEILLHWGLWILCLSPTTSSPSPSPLSRGARAAQYCAIFSPVLTMALLLFLSGMPIAEKNTGKKFWLMSYGKKHAHAAGDDDDDSSSVWRNYNGYLKSTSILIPLPQSIYRPLPSFLKSTLLFDFPFYKFDGEGRDGIEALKEEEEKESKNRQNDGGESGE